LMDWQEATARLESRVSRQPGLMHTPMRVALQATGWKRDAVSEVPGATENPLRDPAWGDWWLERQYVAAGKLSIQDIASDWVTRKDESPHSSLILRSMSLSFARRDVCEDSVFSAMDPTVK